MAAYGGKGGGGRGPQLHVSYRAAEKVSLPADRIETAKVRGVESANNGGRRGREGRKERKSLSSGLG